MLQRFSYPNDPVMPLSDRQRVCLRALALAIEQGEMVFRPTSCPCGAQDDEVVSQVDRLGLPLTNVICGACGLIRANPYIAPASIGMFYGRFYEALYHGGTMTLDEEYDANVDYCCLAVMPVLEAADRVPRGKRILMIGGRGAGMLQPFIDLGNACTVVDFNEDAISNARSRGIEGVAGDYKQVKFANKFDLILLDNVLEHFLDMPEEVTALRDIIAAGGGVFVAVPDAARFDTSFNFADARREFMLCHSYVFSRETVTAHMRALGFHARAWDHKPHPQSLLVYFEMGEAEPPSFSRAGYERQMAAIDGAERKYKLYRIFLVPWFWRTVVPRLKRSTAITALYRLLRGR